MVRREGTFSKASYASPVFVSCLGFNLDTKKPTHFHMDGAEFGHSVLQYDGSWCGLGSSYTESCPPQPHTPVVSHVDIFFVGCGSFIPVMSVLLKTGL